MKTKNIKIRGTDIYCSIEKNKRARKLRLSVGNDGAVSITLPWYVTFREGEKFMIEKIDWITKRVGIAKKNKNNPLFSSPSQKEYLLLKNDAFNLAKNKIEKFNKIYNFKYNKISIRKPKTRWGSCSSKGNLNYNYKIALLPEKYVDYIIVHELCHLGEFNHSKNFWSLVEKTIPDHEEIRKEMRIK